MIANGEFVVRTLQEIEDFLPPVFISLISPWNFLGQLFNDLIIQSIYCRTSWEAFTGVFWNWRQLHSVRWYALFSSSLPFYFLFPPVWFCVIFYLATFGKWFQIAVVILVVVVSNYYFLWSKQIWKTETLNGCKRICDKKVEGNR